MAEIDRKFTFRDLRRLYRDGKPIVALTAYDATFASLVDAAGVEIVLVGDSVSMTMLGHRNTLPVTLEQMLSHTAAVSRGVKRALVIGDMPFMSYQVNADEAVRNAGRFMAESFADGVKLEGGVEVAPTVRRMVAAGIPVMGHIGLMPQHVVADSGYHLHGKSAKDAMRIKADAAALEEAGVFAIVVEGVSAEFGEELTKSVGVPTIGIGAGPHCSGQIQVIHDILGLLEHFVPKHTRRYANLAAEIRAAVGQYASDVRQGSFPTTEGAN